MKLSTQILADWLLERDGHCPAGADNICVLTGVRLYVPGQEMLPQYAYVGQAQDGAPQGAGAFICVGALPEPCRNVIALPEETTVVQAMAWVQEAFEYYNAWDESLQDALNADCELEELLRLSLPVFGNPVFIHDSEFYLLAIAGEDPAPSDWNFDQSRGRYVFNSDLINIYKIDPDYIASLTIRGGAVFPEVIREYKILIINLWQGDKNYLARICVPAKRTKILPGQLRLIEHLGRAVMVALHRQSSHGKSSARMFKNTLAAMLDKQPVNEGEVLRYITGLGWASSDAYMCIKVGVHSRDEFIMSLAATCNRLETLLHDCFALPYQNNLAVIVNLTRCGCTQADCLTLLSTFWREGLFKAGSSDVFYSFPLLGGYFRQASAALEIGLECDETLWSFRFSQYALRYILKYGCTEMPPELLCSKSILALSEYDAQNNTTLYETLRTYLAQNLNAVQTARALFIHRSTFFYRLDRIKSIIKVDLEDEMQRFYLHLSFLLLENK